jgi:hypothetical protein
MNMTVFSMYAAYLYIICVPDMLEATFEWKTDYSKSNQKISEPRLRSVGREILNPAEPRQERIAKNTIIKVTSTNTNRFLN